MKLSDLQSLIAKLLPGQTVSYDFDNETQNKYDLNFTAGAPDVNQSVINNEVKVTVEGQDAIYVNIEPYTQTVDWNTIQAMATQKFSTYPPTSPTAK